MLRPRGRLIQLAYFDTEGLGRLIRVVDYITGDGTGQSNSRGIGLKCVNVSINCSSRLALAGFFPNGWQSRSKPNERVVSKPRRSPP